MSNHKEKETWSDSIDRARDHFNAGWKELADAATDAKERGQDVWTEAQKKGRDAWVNAKAKGMESWEDLKERSIYSANQLAEAVIKFPEDRLFELTITGHSTYYKMLHGVAEHAHYHLGQIVLLKKLIRQAVPHVAISNSL